MSGSAETAPGAKELAKALTGKQRAWALGWVETGNATEAAARAEYKGDRAAMARIGFDNRRNPKIAAYVEALLAEDPLFADAGEQVRILTRIARGEGTTTRTTPTGVVKSAPTFAERVRAIELLSKMTRPDGVSVQIVQPGADSEGEDDDGDVRICVEFKRGVAKQP